MLRRMALLVTALSLLLTPAAAVAGDAEQPEEPVYLSLGTSLAAGVLADENGDSTFGSDVGYADQLAPRLEDHIGDELDHVKLGCDGETTDQFVGGVNDAGLPSKCVGSYGTGSQLGDALATLQTRDVAVVTIDLGSNDVYQAQATCGLDAACLAAEIEQAATNVATIVTTLRIVGGYDGPIIGLLYYNPLVAASVGFFSGLPGPMPPDPAFAVASDQIVQGLNGALAVAYAATGANVADAYAAFNSGDFGDDQPTAGIPDSVDAVCTLTFMCPEREGVKANIHPTKKGYRVIAKAMFSVYKQIDG